MKLYQLLLFLLLYSSASAQLQQWQWLNPQPSGYFNNGIVSVDAQKSFIINSNGDLIRTNDQGNSWSVQQNLAFGQTISYKDSTMVVGAFASAYVSKDLGQTWEKRTVSQQEFLNVQVISRDTIMLTSVFPQNPSHILLSSDRGNTWQLINPDIILKSTWMLTSKVGFATSYDNIYKTINGGQNWSIPDNTAPGGGTCLKFYDPNNAVVFAQGKFWRTTDGGSHWTASVSAVGFEVKFIEYADLNTLTASSDGGVIFRSTDGGINWTGANYGAVNSSGFYGICFSNSMTGFMVGHRGSILKTTDAGVTWNQYAATYIDVMALDMINDSVGYTATWNNIFKKTNTVTGWTKFNNIATPGNFDRFKYIHFFSVDTGVAIMQSPVKLFKTYNGGTNWTEIPLNILYNDEIFDVFTIGQTIFMSTDGAYGKKILRSKDAGETWTTQYTTIFQSDPVLTDLFFTSQKTGYGTHGYYVYKTSDSGRTWNQLAMPAMQILRSVWFSNPATGYAIGDQSHIVKTSDSGLTWTQLHIDPTNNNIPGNMQQVQFANPKIGFVTSSNKIYRTINAGSTWTLHGTPPWDIKGTEIADSSLYIYGIYGSILKRDLRTFEVDSLRFDSLNSCGTKLSAIVSAIYSKVDSIWFQYGIAGFNSTVNATPFTVNDTSLKVNAIISGLSPGTNYKARLKISFRGNYYYSDSINFLTTAMSIPTISLTGGSLLSSSTTGNQWYFNNVAIPGATQSSYTPTQSGNYTVTVTANGCTSNPSAPYSYLVTGVSNIPALENIKIFPNPATKTLMVQNNELKNLDIKIFSITGVEVLRRTSFQKENLFDLSKLSPGTYLVIVKETRTLRSMERVFIKM